MPVVKHVPIVLGMSGMLGSVLGVLDALLLAELGAHLKLSPLLCPHPGGLQIPVGPAPLTGCLHPFHCCSLPVPSRECSWFPVGLLLSPRGCHKIISFILPSPEPRAEPGRVSSEEALVVFSQGASPFLVPREIRKWGGSPCTDVCWFTGVTQ